MWLSIHGATQEELGRKITFFLAVFTIEKVMNARDFGKESSHALKHINMKKEMLAMLRQRK